MNTKNIVLATSLALLFTSYVYASDTNVSTNASTSTNSTAQSGSYNGGNNIITNNPGTVQYSGSFTQRNVPTVALGSFGNSFSSDYCSGTIQGSVGIAGFGGAFGHQQLDKGCQMLRAADMTMRIAGVYAADASATWEFAKTMGPSVSAQQYATTVRAVSFKKAEMADELKAGAVNMICAISDDVRQSLVDAAINCPKHR